MKSIPFQDFHSKPLDEAEFDKGKIFVKSLESLRKNNFVNTSNSEFK